MLLVVVLLLPLFCQCTTVSSTTVHTFVISMGSEPFLEVFIGQNTRLRESPNRTPYLQKYKAISCVSVQNYIVSLSISGIRDE